MPLFNTANLFTFSFPSINRGAEWVTAFLDWAKRKQITINGASKTADFSDDFTSYGTQGSADAVWIPDSTNSDVDISNDYLVISGESADQGVYIDIETAIGETVGTKWVLQFKHTQSAKSNGMNYQLQDSTTRTASTSRDGIGLRQTDTSNFFDLEVCDGVGASSGQVDHRFTITPDTTSEERYIRFIRDGDYVQIIFFADSEYTEVLDSSPRLNISSLDVTGLRYFVVQTKSTTNSIIIDDFKFWNNISVVKNIPSQQTVFFEDDYTTNSGWTQTGTAVTVDSGVADKVDGNAVAGGTDHRVWKDMGSALSDTEFVVEIDYTLEDEATGGGNPNHHVFVLSDASTDPVVSSATQDSISIRQGNNTANQLFITYANGGDLDSPTGASSAFTTSTGSTYYLKLIRKNDNVRLEIYSDSERTNLSGTLYLTVANVTGLRYVHHAGNPSAGGTRTVTYQMDNLKVWNNISEVNPTTLTDYVLPIKIQGDTDLQRKTTETRDEDFSADGWTDQDSAEIGVTAGTGLLWDAERGSNDNSSYDLGSTVSDTQWVWDIDYTTTALTQVGGGDNTVEIYLSSANSATAHSGSADRIGFALSVTSAVNRIEAISTDGTAMDNTGSRDHILDPQNIVGLTRYVRVVRTSSTQYRVIIYADKARTIELDEHTQTIASSIANLRYIVVGNEDGANASATNDHEGTITYMRFWDGITNPVEQETATHTDDFSADAWTDQDTKQQVTGGSLAYDPRRDNTNDASSYDLQTILGSGVNVDDSKWCLQYVQNHSSVYTSGNGNRLWFGISDKDSSTAQNGTHDFIGLYQNFDVNSKHGAVGADGATLPQNNTGTVSPATSTNYYTRISRINKTTMRVQVFTGGYDEVTFYDETLTIASTIQNLRYLWIGNLVDGAGGDSITGTIDDLSFWNGISSPNASARKFVFTDNDLTETATEYSSETISYDPINGDYFGNVRIPSLTTGADTIIQMYYDYSPSANPDYTPDISPLSTADFIDDFNTSTAWTTATSNITFDTVTDEEVDWNIPASTLSERISHDLTSINDNYWLLRGKFDVSAYSANTDGTGKIISFGISSADANPNGTHDFVGWYIHSDSSSGFYGLNAVDANTTFAGSPNVGTYALSVETVYLELLRYNDIAIATVYSDADYTIVLNKQTIAIPSGLTDLRYIHFGLHENDGTTNGTLTGHLDDVEFFDGAYLRNREQLVYDGNYKAVYHLQGNSLDSTVYGNDGTESGTVTYEQQNNSVGYVFNATDTKIDMGSDASLGEIFDGGGVLKGTFNVNSDGESSLGRIFDKGSIALKTQDQSGSNIRLQFSFAFSGVNGVWQTAVNIPINELHQVEVYYNADSVNNDPIIILNGIKLTVGNGLTETGTPTGTRTSETAYPFILGNEAGNTNTVDGLIDNVVVSDKIRPSSQAIATYNAEKADSDMVTAASSVSQ